MSGILDEKEKPKEHFSAVKFEKGVEQYSSFSCLFLTLILYRNVCLFLCLFILYRVLIQSKKKAS